MISGFTLLKQLKHSLTNRKLWKKYRWYPKYPQAKASTQGWEKKCKIMEPCWWETVALHINNNSTEIVGIITGLYMYKIW